MDYPRIRTIISNSIPEKSEKQNMDMQLNISVNIQESPTKQSVEKNSMVGVLNKKGFTFLMYFSLQCTFTLARFNLF